MAKHWWPLALLVVAATATAIAVTYVTKTGAFTNSSNNQEAERKWKYGHVDPPSSNDPSIIREKKCKLRNNFYDEASKECRTCPEPKKYFAVFWETHINGCLEFKKNEDAFKHITHVYWGFSKLDEDTGDAIPGFQGNNATLKECIRNMRNKCVKQLASIGGAADRNNFFKLNTPERIRTFGKSVARIVEEYKLDGVDIDDESGNAMSPNGDWLAHSTNVLDYLKSIREEMDKLKRHEDEPKFTITWDEFPMAINKEACKNKNNEWARCYNPKISDLVDWVNIMLYNLPKGNLYDIFLKETIPKEWAQVVPTQKIVIGGCVPRKKDGQSGVCGEGAVPTMDQLKRYAEYGSKSYGGAMLWTASADYEIHNSAYVSEMGKSGNYGVFNQN